MSDLTIYNWEHGKARPQKTQLASLVSLRGIGKREALAKLKLLKTKEKKAAGKPGKKGRKRSRQ